MKACDEYSIHIQPYVDNTLSCQDLGELRDHLQGCVICRQQVEAGVTLSRLFHRSKPLYIASDALRERVMKIIGGHLQSSADLPD
jgi:hypothetical protein